MSAKHSQKELGQWNLIKEFQYNYSFKVKLYEIKNNSYILKDMSNNNKVQQYITLACVELLHNMIVTFDKRHLGDDCRYVLFANLDCQISSSFS